MTQAPAQPRAAVPVVAPVPAASRLRARVTQVRIEQQPDREGWRVVQRDADGQEKVVYADAKTFAVAAMGLADLAARLEFPHGCTAEYPVAQRRRFVQLRQASILGQMRQRMTEAREVLKDVKPGTKQHVAAARAAKSTCETVRMEIQLELHALTALADQLGVKRGAGLASVGEASREFEDWSGTEGGADDDS